MAKRAKFKPGDLVVCVDKRDMLYPALGLLLEIKYQDLGPVSVPGLAYGVIKWFYNPAGYGNELYLRYLSKLS